MKVTRVALAGSSRRADDGWRCVWTQRHQRCSARAVVCIANPCRIIMTRNGADEFVIQDARGPPGENPLLIIDPNGLAEFCRTSPGHMKGRAARSAPRTRHSPRWRA